MLANWTIDTDRKTQVLIWDRISPMVDDAIEAHKKMARSNDSNHRTRAESGYSDADWLGREFFSWAEVFAAVGGVWEEGMRSVEKMLEKIRDVGTPEPVSRKRRQVLSEQTGEVDVDRAMAGEYDYMRTHRRESSKGSQNLSIVCNVGGLSNVTSQEMWWRAAAIIAVIDVLESAGFSVELWAWNRAEWTYPNKRDSDVMQAVRIKECGEMLDLNLVVNALSTWFFRTINLTSRHIPEGMEPDSGYGSSNHTLGEFRQYLDISEDEVYEMPHATNEKTCVKNARELLTKIIADHS